MKKKKKLRIEAICPSCNTPIFFEIGMKDNELSEVSISKKEAKRLGIKLEKVKGKGI